MFRIARIDARAVSIPLKSPIRMAGVDIAQAQTLIVRITDRDGRIGWGEAAAAPSMTGETPESMVAAVGYLAPHLEGLEVDDPAAVLGLMDNRMYGNHGAKAAMEIALVDLAGKVENLPAHELLGGEVRKEIVMLTMVAGSDPDRELDNTRRQLEDGFTAFKVKVGSRSCHRDLERVAAVRAVAGNEVTISADANQGYDRNTALQFAQGAAQAGLNFMEQLVAGNDLEGMAACAEASSVPLGADEGLHSLDDIRRHKVAGAAKGGSLKTIKLGGMFAVCDAGNLMESLDMHVNLASKVAETGIASAALAHVGVALPQLDWDASITSQYLADDIVVEPIKIRNGIVRPPQGPGLGIAVDEAKLEKYSVRI